MDFTMDAIVSGGGARVEFLLREHANHRRESMLKRRKAKKVEEPERLKGGKTRRTKKPSVSPAC